MKPGWLAETHGSPRAVLATATPFTNTFSEIYLWRRLGHQLPAFDVWARTHCTSETFMEMTPGGAPRAKTRLRRMINEPEPWRSLRLTSNIKIGSVDPGCATLKRVLTSGYRAPARALIINCGYYSAG